MAETNKKISQLAGWGRRWKDGDRAQPHVVLVDTLRLCDSTNRVSVTLSGSLPLISADNGPILGLQCIETGRRVPTAWLPLAVSKVRKRAISGQKWHCNLEHIGCGSRLAYKVQIIFTQILNVHYRNFAKSRFSFLPKLPSQTPARSPSCHVFPSLPTTNMKCPILGSSDRAKRTGARD